MLIILINTISYLNIFSSDRDLWVLAIADSNPSVHVTLRPEAKYIGNMHGNEAVTQEVLLHFIDYLLYNQMNDSSVDFILKNTRVHIMPSMNPDGYGEANVGDCQGVDGRYNENNVDLNRNFPDIFDCNDKIVLQPETSSVINWLEKNLFILSANLHSGRINKFYLKI
jgi:carboxypeptidase D